MKRLLACLILVGCADPPRTAPPSPQPLPEAIKQEIASLFADWSSGPGGALLIAREGAIDYVGAWGLARLDPPEPATPRTSFRLSSMSKAFTAMAVMILGERGLLHDRAGIDRGYELSLGDVFDGGSATFSAITLRQLLSHSSGLPAYSTHPGRTDEQPLNDADVLAEMKPVRPEDLWFSPGTQYRYSNTGYSLLASVVEALAQRPFAQVIREEIVDKLGMQRSDELDVYHPRPLPTRAYGYARESGLWRLDDWDNTFAVLGDGMMYASAEDLALWDRALYPDSPTRLVGPDTLREAFTSHTPPGAEPYGFGWSLATWEGLENIGHGGATRGFRSRIERFPEVRTTFAILRNGEDRDDDAQNALWNTKLSTVAQAYLFPYLADWGPVVGASAGTVTLDRNRNGLADPSDPVFTFAESGALLSPRVGLDPTSVWRLECAFRIARARLSA